jgi:HEAT repeat protein
LGLGEIGDARGVEPLIQTLQDEDSFLRRVAAVAVGNIGDARAIEPLTRALEDEDGLVRQAAAEALEKIRAKQGAE